MFFTMSIYARSGRLGLDGEMPPRQLTDERLQDPAVHELAAKVKVVESEAMNRQYPHD